MHRTLLGHVNVDSGQLMVTDPCYLTNFKNNDFNPKTKYMNVRDNKKIVVHPYDRPTIFHKQLYRQNCKVPFQWRYEHLLSTHFFHVGGNR